MLVTMFDAIDIDLNYIVRPIVYIFIGVIVYYILKAVINTNMHKRFVKKRHYKKRITTINALILNIIKYLIIISVIISILTVFKVDVRSIITGLGITAAIVGLAFQDFIKDILAGISIVSEDQYEIGDTIKIGDFMGKVTLISLRSTRIQDFKGATKIIANHTITEVINYNLEDSLALVDIAIDYKANTDEVLNTLEKIAGELDKSLENTKGPVEVWGIEDLSSSAVVYRMCVLVDSMNQYVTQRIMRKAIKDKLEEAKIKIPYQQIEVHNGK
ncbi:MAG: mechanosensitive ion channel family protein [Bacilli bacterium]|nr:mechanosensitive ion channel family protein [Bacilli bacterium]